jgi:hypothetical protein
MARRGRYSVRHLAAALALVAGCAAASPQPPDPAADATDAVSTLIASAGEVCASLAMAATSGGDVGSQTIRGFEEVSGLGDVAVPEALVGGAHEQWWIRYLAARRAAVLELLDAADEALLPSQQQDPTRWRAAADRFEASVASLGEREQRELRTMRAGAAAAVERGHPASVVLNEVERRLAERLGLTACNASVLRGSLAGDVSVAEDRQHFAQLAELLVGDP